MRHRITLVLAVVLVPLAGAIACAQQESDLVRVSVDGASDPLIRRCLAGADGLVARYTDDEPFVAVDPANGDQVVATWQTRSGSGSVIQWVRSTDGGRRWSAPRAVPVNACAGGPVATATRSSDPWVTIGPDGRIYLSAIAWTPGVNDGPDLVSALVVVASADGGVTWESPVAAAIAPSTAVSHDNLAITADPTRPGTVYATTTRFDRPDSATFYGQLGFTRSFDGGRTWSAIRAINPGRSGERIGAPQIVVDPRTGRIYAIYFGRIGGVSRIGVRWSDDQGATWSDEAVAAGHVRPAQVRHPGTGAEFVLADDIVQAAVSASDGRLVIAYADAHLSEGRRAGLSIVSSADGVQWATPVVVSDSSQGSAWLPTIAMGERDAIVTHYTAHFDAAAGASPRMQVRWRRLVGSATGFAARDGGILDQGALAWPGDYQGLVAVRGGFLAVFGRDHDIFARRFVE